ncbi:protein transport protein SEC13 homolog B-like [Asparagus officinalis]|uniref:protein transport protein SEC13 homolog B-like n=1 Tax=Asparagus officinalis TaxID=4686 RepID=UPI00098E10D8|nr:protein transport protein SEC13 homolog B-like [Asparagus officinalis]XP_020251387.1 protein transport protein SEC13 homolog B-like [Asparagus officinalis]
MPSQKIETGHQDVVHDVCMDYYGKRLATASSDATIKIIGVSGSSSQHLAVLSGHQGPVWQVAWTHPKFGTMLASCSYDGRVIIWKEGNKPEEWIQAHIFTEHKSSVNSIAWAPHELGLSLACGSSDGNISVFTARPDGGWDTTKIDQAHQVGVTSVSWAPSTAPGALVGSGLLDPVYKLVSGGCDNTVKVWKLFNGSWKMDCFPALQMHSDWVRDVAWAPNLGLPKSTIASSSQDGTVVIWTVAKEGDQWEGRILNDFKTPVWRVSWSLTGNILAVADGNNNVTLPLSHRDSISGWVSFFALHELLAVPCAPFVLYAQSILLLVSLFSISLFVSLILGTKRADIYVSFLLYLKWSFHFPKLLFTSFVSCCLVSIRSLVMFRKRTDNFKDFTSLYFGNC